MEGNLSSGNMISGSGGAFDLQSSMRVHHQLQNNPLNLHHHHHNQNPNPNPNSNPNLQSTREQSMMLPSNHENFPLRIHTIQDCNRHNQTISLAEFNKGERRTGVVSDEDDHEHDDETRAKNMNMNINMNANNSQWHRVKWNDPMVRLLITAVSYVGEDASIEFGGGSRRKYSNLQKKGKWKSISKVMAERGHFVSPQQCEDKFNDLNKRYKRLNEILGRGTSCEVVENPSLLEVMDHVSDKLKEEVRKILSSKHLHYEEMCSYHNGNRLHLPPDPELQHSLRLALRARDDHENVEDDEDDQDPYLDDHDEYYDHHHHGEGSSKRLKQSDDFQVKNVQTDMNNRLIQLEEQKIQIQAQMLELQKERFKWQRFQRKKDNELEMMRMDNERMKMENDQMALELKRKEMSADLNQ